MARVTSIARFGFQRWPASPRPIRVEYGRSYVMMFSYDGQNKSFENHSRSELRTSAKCLDCKLLNS